MELKEADSYVIESNVVTSFRKFNEAAVQTDPFLPIFQQYHLEKSFLPKPAPLIMRSKRCNTEKKIEVSAPRTEYRPVNKSKKP